ncbi:amino acid permease [Acidipropionibacterium timonense]|uniref:amino acid permease n=1 Tax=Acidipropionibacterium timonense TaxID=2161818 RepID=UPI001FD8DB9A|nr:amino acid permease [Acidipropionibacterium timonense]
MSTAHPSPLSPEPAPSQRASSQELHRSLGNRHIQLIAIGGAIGTGLFMGSGKTVHAAGPSLVLVYIIIGLMLFFVMRAMGELLLFNLDYKSFQDFSADLLGPWAGFFSGWTYWLCWVVTGMADVIAISGYWSYWVGDERVSAMLAALTMLALLGLNLLTVRLFGELEFWFAMIKIVAILALIVTAAVMVVVAFKAPNGRHAALSNLWTHHGFFPRGLSGFLSSFQIAVFAFVGIELVGTTSAETADPMTTLPKAINSIPLRVVLFYVGALLAIMCVTPWDEVNPDVSPFVNLFGLLGLAFAASLMNFVVLTSASSSCNSGIYSTSRMLYGLAHKGMSPRIFGRLSRQGVPVAGLVLSVGLIIGALVLMLNDSIMGAFTVVTTISAVLFIAVWSLILVSYMMFLWKHPQGHAASSFKMPGARFMPQVVLVFFVFVLYVLTRDADTRQALLVTPVWFLLLGVGWFFARGRIHRDDSHTAEPR